jgi:electron transport complex protein RnfD
MNEKIIVSPAPHIGKHLSTQRIMLDVIIGLVPAMIAAGIYFRLRALFVITTCVVTCMVSEWLCNIIRKKPNSVTDLSAALTGIILAFSLPPAIPLWIPVIGGAFAIIIGKMVFGGLGANIFNPAMVGRTFLAASFGALMTTWTVPATIDSTMPQMSPTNPVAVTQATPLAWSKEAIKKTFNATAVFNEQLNKTFWGNTGGCLGETSVLALIIGGIWLLARKTITWHIPVGVLVAAFVCAAIPHLINSDKFISPVFHLTSGAMLFGAIFIATDPVTAPLTEKGMLIFAAGVGAVTILIRIVGEYPEGFMYAILLMNSVTPLIDRSCRHKPLGGLPNG